MQAFNPAEDKNLVFSRKQVLSLASLAAAFALVGCSSSNDSLTEQANAGDDKGYIAGDGSVTEYAEAERGEPVDFTGTLYSGEEISATSLRGKPLVLNFWYAGCAPCRAEAPSLKELYDEFGQKVSFYGANVRDEQGTAEAFERKFEINYPSFDDTSGKVLYDLSKYVPAQAVPTTLVLDAQGRVAARILGQLDKSILKTILSEMSSSAS